MTFNAIKSVHDPGIAGRQATQQAFSTDHLRHDIGRRAVRGAVVTVSSQATRLALQMGSTVVLARLLTPRDFGLVGMVTVVLGLTGLFKDLGLSAATVQRAELTHEQLSTLFWINVGLSALLMLGLAAASPLVAWAYGEPQLTSVTLALAGTLLIGGLTAQHHALLRRQMRFRELATTELVSMALGVGVAIASALAGAGYWALVLGTAANAATNMVMVWSYSRWTPGRPQRHCGVRSMLAFGGNLTSYNVLSYFSVNADSMLIGWYWGAGPLGMYAKAYSLLMLPLRQIKAPISNVAIPALCRLQGQPAQFRSLYLKALSVIAFVTIPTGTAAVIGADEIIRLLLGEQWTPAAVVFQALAVSLPFQSVLSCVGWLFITTGRTDRMLKWGLFSCGAVIVSFVVGLPYGPLGVAVAYSAANILIAWPCSAYGLRGTPVPMRDFWGAMVKPLISALVASAVALAARRAALFWGAGEWAALGAAWAMLAGTYLAMMFYVFESGRQHFAMLRHLRQKPAVQRVDHEGLGAAG